MQTENQFYDRFIKPHALLHQLRLIFLFSILVPNYLTQLYASVGYTSHGL